MTHRQLPARILIVDDDVETCRLIAELVDCAADASCISARPPTKAMELAQQGAVRSRHLGHQPERTRSRDSTS